MIKEKYKDIQYLSTLKEDQYYDKKSARIDPFDLLKTIVAFANAGGGYISIGIEDDGTVTGFNYVGAHSINDYKNVSVTELRETPILTESLEIQVKNVKGEEDTVLLLSVPSSNNKVIKSHNGKVYLRYNDKSKELSPQQIIQLQYDKGESLYENEIIKDSSVEDIDHSLLDKFKEINEVSSLSDEEVLKARGFLKNGHLTVAGILLFGSNPTKYLPQARLRFIKYEDDFAGVGKNFNVSKEKTFDGAIPKIITEAKEFISTQFREFQYLDIDGVFKKMPEYPEFAWVEGIVNALTHRNYSLFGDHIRVMMFNNRLEISSPGNLPNLVTLDNMQNTRFSRNPNIARTLTEFGWVKEMNEGVKRIYSEMENAFLNKPIYSEPNNASVLLVLENNILNRTMRNIDSISNLIGIEIFKQLSKDEIFLLQFAFNYGKVDSKIGATIINKSPVYVRTKLKKLVTLGLLKWNGSSKNDPTQYYYFDIK